MKNTKRAKLFNLLTSIINVRAWLDWDRLKTTSLYFLTGIKQFFVIQPQDGEKFEVVKKRLNLTDADLLVRQKSLLRLSFIMLGCAILTFIYSVYLFVTEGYKGGIVGLVVMCIALVLAFRYHFWSFQIKERKLACTIKEWFNCGLMGGK